jgi:hypothetical protein
MPKALFAFIAVALADESLQSLVFAVSGMNATVVSYTSKPVGVLTIPGSYQNLPVTAIAENAFFWCENITKVIFPSSIREIGNNAFSHCTALESIQFATDANLQRIGSRAFHNCWSLHSMSLPSSIRVLESFCFSNCRALKKVEIPPQLELIGDGAFSLSAIEEFSVDYQSRTLYAKLGVLYDKRISVMIQFPLAKQVTLFEVPSSVTVIGNHSFAGHATIEAVHFGNFLLEIGE